MPTSRSTKLYNKVAVTTGDPNGIGFEVSCKALCEIGPQTNTVFILYRDHQQNKKQARYFKLLDEKFLRLTFSNQSTALSFFNKLVETKTVPKNLLIDLALKSSAAEWIDQVFKSCLEKEITSVVTGPISKTLIKTSAYSHVGHTGFLRALVPGSDLHMGFVGKYFNVLLASDHISLDKVSAFLTKKKVRAALLAAKQLKKLIGSKKKIAVLGLNPHSGESGMLGSFEKKLLGKLPSDFQGPLVPDAAFLKSNWNKYSVYVCMYHDQGLIPFKLVHGQDSGVHVTTGLPFIRTSVDHGTAFDIYNKSLANPASMIDAIRLNLKLLRGSYV